MDIKGSSKNTDLYCIYFKDDEFFEISCMCCEYWLKGRMSALLKRDVEILIVCVNSSAKFVTFNVFDKENDEEE